MIRTIRGKPSSHAIKCPGVHEPELDDRLSEFRMGNQAQVRVTAASFAGAAASDAMGKIESRSWSCPSAGLVSATANPAFRRQLGQSPRGAAEGNGAPHSGQQGVALISEPPPARCAGEQPESNLEITLQQVVWKCCGDPEKETAPPTVHP